MLERNLILHPLPEIKHNRIIERIPTGGYCHTTIRQMQPEGLQLHLDYCPFWYGYRPDGGCVLYGRNTWSEDAIKICTIKPFNPSVSGSFS